MKFVDLTDRTFGNLTAKFFVKGKWFCLCSCGAIKGVFPNNLKSGATTSCGCKTSEKISAALTQHGMFRTPTYNSWAAMMQRCFDSNFTEFKYWGGRGITVCIRWREFKNFLADTGLRPDDKTLDRYPNNDGNYEPLNCRWATAKEQRNNQERA